MPAINVAKLAASPKPRSIRSLARSLAADATALRERLFERLQIGDRQIQSAQESLASDLAREISAEETADVLAQAAVCGAAILPTERQLWDSARAWFMRQASEWERVAVDLISTEYSVLSTKDLEESACSSPLSLSPSLLLSPRPAAAHLHEPFLHAYQRSTRKRRGVFFTPQPIADYIVRQVDERLRADFQLSSGLATAAGRPDREADASRSP